MWCSNLAGGENFFKKLFILFFFTPEKEELITLLNSGMFAVKICKWSTEKVTQPELFARKLKKKPLYTHHWKSLVSTLKNFFKPKHHLNPWHGNNLTIKKRKPKKLWYHFRRQKRPRRKKENENKYLQPWLKFKLSKLSLELRFFFLPENIR